MNQSPMNEVDDWETGFEEYEAERQEWFKDGRPFAVLSLQVTELWFS